MEILKNPDLAVLYPLLEEVPRYIIDDFLLPIEEGIVWGYKSGEDESMYDLESGEMLNTVFDTVYRTLTITYNDTTLEVEINFGLVQEGLTPIFYVGGSSDDVPEDGDNWDGYGTWENQLEKTGFGGYLIEHGEKVYFISKDAFIPVVGTDEEELIDRETLRPLGLEGQDSVNNNGLINGVPTGYMGTGALYY